MNDIDLDKIEEELKLIKSEDWRLGLTGENIWDTSDCIIHESLDKDLSMEQKIINAKFFFKSPERIASLVKRVRELELRNRSLERSLQHKIYEQIVKLGRGSDEV